MSRGRAASQLLRDFMLTSSGRVTIAIGFLLGLSALEINLGPLLAVTGTAGFSIFLIVPDTGRRTPHSGDRFAERHRSLAGKFGVPFARLRPPIEGGEWNDVLRARSQHQASTL
jgi:hypothetical protein